MDLLKKISIRFLLVYLILYIFPFPLSYIPFEIGDTVSKFTSSFWQQYTTIFANFIFGYEKKISFIRSGDNTYGFLLLATRLLSSLIIILIWSGLDRLKREEKSIWNYFLVALRYYLAYKMFYYGFMKIFYLQFTELNFYSLNRTFGDSSPMLLLWRFMGYSEAYSIFTGSIEVLGGIFLLFRHTKILGGFITFGVMLHVFVLNMTYDVPVKILSFHLCIIALIIISSNIKNVYRFFFLNTPTIPSQIEPYVQKDINRYGVYFLKGFLICFVLFTIISKNAKMKNEKPEPSILYGLYNVSDFTINGDSIPPLTTDKQRWKKLIIDKRTSMIIKMDDSGMSMRHEIDTTSKLLTLTSYSKDVQFTLEYKKKDSVLYLKSIINNDTINITGLKKDREDFFLIKRGFHWINEFPMQR